MDRKTRAAAPIETREYVAFRVGGEEYGLEINSIAEVIRPLRITALPRMPEFIEGVINLRGTIIPVVDLRRRFDVKPAQNDPGKVRMMITRGALPGKGLLGLIVDGVSDVVELSREQIERAPDAATGRNAGFIDGMGKLGDRLLILIDVGSVLTRQERVALVEAGDADA